MLSFVVHVQLSFPNRDGGGELRVARGRRELTRPTSEAKQRAARSARSEENVLLREAVDWQRR